MSEQFEELVPNARACRELGVTTMTAWRWDRIPAQAPAHWPAPIKRGTTRQARTYRRRSELERCKATLLKQAIEARQTHSNEATAVA
jgi:hypothetical protein